MLESFAFADSYDDSPIVSDIPNEKDFLSDLESVKYRHQKQHFDRHLQRREEERLQLQMQTQRLEMYFSHLNKLDSPVLKRARKNSPTAQENLLQRIETALLRASSQKTITNETKSSKSLQSSYSKQQSSMETESLASSMLSNSTQSKLSNPQHFSPATLRNDPVALRKEIVDLMDKMYHEAKATLDPITGAAASIPILTCQYAVRLDSKKGPTTHLTSETPLNCGLDKAREVLAAIFSLPESPQIKLRRTRTERINSDGDIEKEFSMDLGGSRTNECMDGIGLLRRHNEVDCELVLWAAVSFHHSGKISFQECSWMAAARSSPQTLQESVIRVSYHLSSEKTKMCSYIDGEHIDHVRNHALGAIGAKMKAQHHMLQRKMLIETGREDLASFIT